MTAICLLAVAGSFLLALAATWAVRAWARRTGFIDHPGGHKTHKIPMALGGGIAIFTAICAPILLVTAAAWVLHRDAGTEAALAIPDWLPAIVRAHLSGIASKLPHVLAIVAGALVLHIVGLIDDRRPLGPTPKFMAQIVVAAVLAGPLGMRIAEALPAAVSFALTVFWIVLIINAFNFLDNMDGLSAGVAAIAAAVFAVAAFGTGQIFIPVMAWVVVGALLGFLVFNFSPASIFMGDSGSMVIGYFMSLLTILTTYYDPRHGATPWGVLMPILVLAVPLYDVLSVVTHRIRAGQSPLRGDSRHFSHRLVRRGLSRRGAVLTVYLATAATALPAILLPRLDWPGASLLMLQCLCVVAMIAILEHVAPPSGPEIPR